MSQPPYGAPPPQPGQPQGYPQQPGYPAAPPQGYPPQPGAAAPPPYLQGGAPGGAPVGFPGGAPGGAPGGYGYGPALPPPPPSQRRTIGFLMGLLTTIVLIGFVVLALVISKVN